MKLLAMLFVCILLAGCPKKQAEGDAPSEPVEGASVSDKSGEGSSDEMQEKKGSSSDAAPAEGGDEKK